jgi:hypothetical protein
MKEQLAEQLLEAEKQYPKEHVLKTPKKPTAEEKIKAGRVAHPSIISTEGCPVLRALCEGRESMKPAQVHSIRS